MCSLDRRKTNWKTIHERSPTLFDQTAAEFTAKVDKQIEQAAIGAAICSWPPQCRPFLPIAIFSTMVAAQGGSPHCSAVEAFACLG